MVKSEEEVTIDNFYQLNQILDIETAKILNDNYNEHINKSKALLKWLSLKTFNISKISKTVNYETKKTINNYQLIPNINVNFNLNSNNTKNLTLLIGELWEPQHLLENNLTIYVLTNLAMQIKYEGNSKFKDVSAFISSLKKETIDFYKKRGAIKLISMYDKINK
jgi:hypothetical protein